MKDPTPVVHIVVEEGPDRGRELSIPEAGARVGRSSSNDITLNDPSLSRFHCRFYFKADGALHLADLASTNETLVNDKPIQDTPLRNGDRVTIGETGMRVVAESRAAPAAAREGRDIDLGLSPAPVAAAHRGIAGLRRFLWTGALALLVAGGAVLVFRSLAATRSAVPAVETGLNGLELVYEKVEASKQNIFFYELSLRDGILSVRVQNLADGRHVEREKEVEQGLLETLARSIENAGFFQLREEYTGRAADVWESMDLTVTSGRRAHRVRVLNRLEPDAFREARRRIEEFGQNEIGLAALALPPERLQQMARDAWQAGQNFFQQREVRHDNLARAIRSFTEVEWYLETVEPKPEFYAEAVAQRQEANRMLQERYDERMFLADRAIRLRDWEEANRHLRTLLDMLPDRSDERYRRADLKLMDVQRRMTRR